MFVSLRYIIRTYPATLRSSLRYSGIHYRFCNNSGVGGIQTLGFISECERRMMITLRNDQILGRRCAFCS